ncbi:hypothetical protein AB6A40_001513 [Gnathostoma spinigerum]|uniref:protein-histidine N-methyltransferase n=1 Tax=Gnathostoma spinigerum TaxID=75299 RepID=A0ABD6E4C0_9BILA
MKGLTTDSKDDSKSVSQNELIRLSCELWEKTLCHTPETNSSLLWQEHLMIREKLESIAKIQMENADISEKSPTRKEALAKFLEWVNTVGIEHEGVAVDTDDGDLFYGLKAVSSIQSGSDIVKVPRTAILSLDEARKSIVFRKAFERDMIIKSMDNVALALMLCCHKLLPNSFWHSYLNVLPNTYDTPLHFSVDELQSLRPSPVFEDSLLLYRSVARQFIYFLLIIVGAQKSSHFKRTKKESVHSSIFSQTPFTQNNFTFNLYRWAVSSVSTRINLIPSLELKDPSGSPKMIPALIPFLDMANHENLPKESRNMVNFSVHSDSAVIATQRNYCANERITIYYGSRSSHDFFLHNGFVPPGENVNESFKLKLGLSKTDKFRTARLDLLRGIGFSTDSNIFLFEVKCVEPYVDRSLIEFAKIFTAKDPSVIGEMNDVETKLSSKQAWSFLRERFYVLRLSYGELSSEPLTGRQLMINRLKRSELKLLDKVVAFCDNQLTKLEG